MKSINIFIPSYHRPYNLKTAVYYKKLGYDMSYIHIFVDSEADDIEKYEESCKQLGVRLHVFDMCEARERYDYVHRASPSRRSAGQARNMFQDFAMKNGIDFYLVQDDDTSSFQIKHLGQYAGQVNIDDIAFFFGWIENFMRKHHIGCFGFPQTGDFYGGIYKKLFRPKIMNTTFYLIPYVYRAERGVQDDDTSMFTGMLNEGYFCGQTMFGLTLLQMLSCVQNGGLTDLYNECKLYNKAMITPLQFPSAIHAEYQKKNGNRIHHRINYRYIVPELLKGNNGNIHWDSYPEDVPFTNEPKRVFKLNR